MGRIEKMMTTDGHPQRGDRVQHFLLMRLLQRGINQISGRHRARVARPSRLFRRDRSLHGASLLRRFFKSRIETIGHARRVAIGLAIALNCHEQQQRPQVFSHHLNSSRNDGVLVTQWMCTPHKAGNHQVSTGNLALCDLIYSFFKLRLSSHSSPYSTCLGVP